MNYELALVMGTLSEDNDTPVSLAWHPRMVDIESWSNRTRMCRNLEAGRQTNRVNETKGAVLAATARFGQRDHQGMPLMVHFCTRSSLGRRLPLAFCVSHGSSRHKFTGNRRQETGKGR